MSRLLQGFLSNAVCFGILAVAALPAQAQEAWKPTRPIRVVVPFPPGGGGDILTRILTKPMEASLGQSLVVDNKPGATGAIGSDFAYRSAPDGHTLLSTSLGPMAMYPHMSSVPFDAARFVPIGGIGQMGYVLMGRGDLPAASLGELRTLMKSRTLSYASGGAGSPQHVLTELFAKEAGAALLHVPYQGAAPAAQAILGGQVDLMMVPLAVASQYRGRLRAYALSSAERGEWMKDVATFKEHGMNVVGEAWAALLAPPGTPEAVVESLSRALRQALASPEVIQKLREQGMSPMSLSRKEFAEFYSVEYRRWGEVIKSANIRAE